MQHTRIEAAMGVKIAAHYMEKAVAGTSLFVLHPEDEEEELKQEVMKDFENVMASFPKQPRGVFVQASTLGAHAPAACPLGDRVPTPYDCRFIRGFARVPADARAASACCWS
jgi:hypothetical protein